MNSNGFDCETRHQVSDYLPFRVQHWWNVPGLARPDLVRLCVAL